MSNVKVQGNASGTGSLTIAAPNTNTDRTLTLPDESGTLLTDSGAISVSASAPDNSVVVDAAGNAGLGVTPSAWGTASSSKAMQIGTSLSFLSFGSGGEGAHISGNTYWDGTNWRYLNTRGSLRYELDNAGSSHKWYTAPSGTAGNAISFTQAMTLDASGNLMVGGTSIAALDGVFGIVAGGSGKSSGGVAIESSTSQWLTYTNSDQAMIFYDARLNFERARIDSAGDFSVGFKTNNPSIILHSTSNSTSAVSTLYGYFRDDTGTSIYDGVWVRFGRPGNWQTDIRFATSGGYSERSGVERARITASGDLLVGTATYGGDGVSISGTQGNNFWYSRASTSNAYNQLAFHNPSGFVGAIQTASGTTSYLSLSDYRIKENVQPMVGALAKVAALKPVTFTWKADGVASEGFIAHELQEVCPIAVSGTKDAVDADGNPVYQGIDTSFLVATLTAAIQELNAKVDAQAAEIAALKGTV